MRMIDRVIKSMQDTGLIEGMSLEDADTLATSALEAMREPTRSMTDAFWKNVIPWFNDDIEDGLHLYKVMIDAALNE